ncbi:ATP-binding protein [Bradyrhizobium japonicum]|uniref:ATP-binding protein n=1 Tax=Bradyrhizobium japonicum TaxID=375 RepID=UPI001BAD7EE4|nr:DUF87 domain-containing protein [Bradyrhizobium japonicum]MBR0804332.1 ATP-binding protein [Bradyrhizobium japonicum]
MPTLPDVLKLKIAEKVFAGSTINAERRIAFSGPPRRIMRELLQSFERDGGLKLPSGEMLPVLMLDNSVTRNPIGLASGACTEAHVIDVRNSDRPYFLLLVPPHQEANLSLETTYVSVGVAGIDEDTASWKWWEQPFVEELADELRKASGLQDLDDVLKLAFEEGASVSIANDAREHQWELFEKLFVLSSIAGDDWYRFIAMVGLPRCESASAVLAAEALGQIADRLNDEGITKAIEAFNARATEVGFGHEVAEALKEFEKYLHAACSAPVFKQAPTYWYSPLRRATPVSPLPTWWNVLDLAAWQQLLGGEEIPNHGLEMEVVNPALPTRIGSSTVVMDVVKLTVTTPAELPELNIALRRGQSPATATEIATVASIDCRATAEDAPTTTGTRAVIYRAEAIGRSDVTSARISVISLASFRPRSVFYAPMAEKVTLPRLQKGKSNNKEVWSSEIVFRGPGAHQIDVLVAAGCTVAESAVVVRDNDGGTQDEQSVDVEQGFEGRKTIRLDILEPLSVELVVSCPDGELVIRASCVLDRDEVSEGYRSEYRRLVASNHSPAKAMSATVLPRWTSLDRLQGALIKDENSFRPAVISLDAIESQGIFTWDGSAVFSKYAFIGDIRPPMDEFVAPAKLVEHRRNIQALLKRKEIELLEPENLAALLEDEVPNEGRPFREVLIAYVREFVAWIESSKQTALWFDTVSYVLPQDNTGVLRSRPHAILLTPLHPLRLGWQCLAQKVMQDALDANKSCPGASYLDPSSVPDAMPLWLWGPSGTPQESYFLALENNSDYWAILWDAGALESLNDPKVTKVFGETFGLKIEGLAAGLSVSQIKRTLSDLAQIRSARNALKVRVRTDTAARTFCNDGLMEWAIENLGPYDADQRIGDTWSSAGLRRLEVCDLRKAIEHPAPEELQNLTADTLGAVKWRFREQDDSKADVALIGNLKLLNPKAERQDGVATAIGWGAVLHRRVRRQLPNTKAVIESRCSSFQGAQGNDLASSVCELSVLLEGLSATGNALSFVANTELLRAELDKSLYCAVSSSVADPASFFNIADDAYLWEFDMPSPGPASGPSHGYYLLAKETQPILEAVNKTLVKSMPPAAKLGQSTIARLMREASSRGTPELRKWASGGVGASGEIGVVVALRLLDGRRGDRQEQSGLLGSEDALLNLIIPVDPFEGPINALRAEHSSSNERPDLLVASIRISDEGGVAIRLTPIEVKFRSSRMSELDREGALQQAVEFAKFLQNLCVYQLGAEDGSRLWAIAKGALLADLIDFGFRIEANLGGGQGSADRAEKASAVLAAILADKAQVEVDARGRLVLIDKADESACLDDGGDELPRTIELSEEDAVSLLVEDNPAILGHLRTQVGDWQLKVRVQRPLPRPAPSSSPESSEDDGGGSGQPLPGVATTPPEAGASQSKGADEQRDGDAVLEGPPAAVPPPAQHSDKGVHFPVGRNLNPLNPGQEFFFWPSNTELTHLNVGILGDLGTGKTQLVKGLIYRLSRSAQTNRGQRVKFLILDYKGDYIDEEFRTQVGSKVYKPQLLPINLFDLTALEGKSLTPWLDRFNFFADTLTKIHNVSAPIQKERLKQAVRAAYEWAATNGMTAPTIYQVFDQYKAIIGPTIDTTYSILSDLIDRQVFEPDLAKIRPFSELMDGVFVLDLKALGADDRSKNMLVAIFLNLFYEYMLGVPKKEFVGSAPQLRALDSVLLVDEADNIMRFDFDVLNRILVEDREFGVGVWLSSQYFDHFTKTEINYAQPLLTWFIHRVPSISMSQLRSIGLSSQSATNDTLERIKSLKKHECLYKSLGADGKFMRGYPFYELVAKKDDTG